MSKARRIIYYCKPRYRDIELYLKDKIIVTYKNEIIEANKIEIEDLSWEVDRPNKNDYINELLDLDNAYCPEYLKNILKTLRYKDLKEIIHDDEYKNFDELLQKDFKKYLSVFYEDEIFKIILKFGKAFWKIVKPESNEFILNLTNQEFEKSLNEFIKILQKKTNKIKTLINDLIQKIGTPVDLGDNLQCDWSEFIYSCVLVYLFYSISEAKTIKELGEPKNIFDNNPTILYKVKILFDNILIYLNSIYKEEFKTFHQGVFKYKTKTDIKLLAEIRNIMPFIINYIDNNYGKYKLYYEDWQADHLVDLLEEHRNFLSIKGKKIKDDYSYDKLYESYNRKLKGY